MKTLGEVLALSCEYLKSKDKSFSRRDVEDLFAHILHIKRLDLYINFERPLDEKELAYIREGIKRLSKHEPIQYIEGEVQFYGCAITVGPGVLIPRPETELLVDSIVKELSKQPLAEKKLLDLCCGSGCIAIAIKKALPELEVIASDISKEAVQYTTCNAEHNGVHIKILQGNLLEALHEKVNFLVCNPPYISEAEFQGLDASVKDFEPYVALVSGPTGLEVYQKIAATSRNYVTEKIWLEIGKDQGQLVKSLFQDAGYMNIHVEKDLSGHDRYIYI